MGVDEGNLQDTDDVDVILENCLDVTFSEYFCTITVLSYSSCGEYVVRFLLPDGVFLPYDHGLDFLHQFIM